MGNKAVQAQATSRDGSKLTVQSHETDSPILPVAQLRELGEFRPDLIDFVIEQTRLEAEHRRREDSRTNWMVFSERMFGMIAALAVSALGVGGGIYAGMNGHPELGGTIAVATIGGLATAFVKRKNREAPDIKKR